MNTNGYIGIRLKSTRSLCDSIGAFKSIGDRNRSARASRWTSILPQTMSWFPIIHLTIIIIHWNFLSFIHLHINSTPRNNLRTHSHWFNFNSIFEYMYSTCFCLEHLWFTFFCSDKSKSFKPNKAKLSNPMLKIRQKKSDTIRWLSICLPHRMNVLLLSIKISQQWCIQMQRSRLQLQIR